jgi:hypothetical protein
MLASTDTPSYETLLHEEVARYYADPDGFVLAMFPWGEPGELEAYPDGPQPEQRAFLQWLGQEVRGRAFDGVHAVDAIRGAIASGHGIGKGALTGMLVAFIMSTRPHAKGVITANTNDQLQDKTWAAIMRWVRLCRTAHWFEINTTIMYRRGHRETWKCSPQTCADENSEAFAGQHNLNSTSFYINDEDSNVPQTIHEVQEGGCTDGEPMWFLFGNPTRRSGYFYDAVFGTRRHRWQSWVIDARTSALTNKQQIAEWVEDYGEDSDFVRVRVRGLPPNASDAQYIDHDRVKAAQAREVVVLPDEPLVAGCDLAWGGADWNVIRFRRGRDARSIPPVRIPGKLTKDPAVLTNRLADVLTAAYDGHQVAMLFMDSAGIAGPVAQRLRELGHRNVTEVNFGADSPNPKRRFYRDHMWAELHDWLPTGAIDTHPRLETDLQTPGLRPDSKQRIWLESKEDIKKRGEKSPDDGDALALTFAAPVVAPKQVYKAMPGLPPVPSDQAWMRM